MKRPITKLGLGAVLAAVTLLSACSSASSTAVSPAGSGNAATSNAAPVKVVASTDVWGSVVSAIGGPHVSVSSIITDPSADPHSYEANARNQLAVSRASLIIENGGGYDDFVDRMVSSAGSKATVINAVDASGYTGADLNEHVWYDFPTVDKVVAKITTALTAADPANGPEFSANAASFARRAGVGVAITEPVPLYMLTASGLDNKTPAAFSEAIESDSDAPASAVAQTLALFSGKQVKALVYNEQTTGPQTQLVLVAAKKNGIAVVPVTETLPSGTDYLSWMTANLGAIAKAVA
jgi:zinc/manganese transport system substrate-binding protein